MSRYQAFGKDAYIRGFVIQTCLESQEGTYLRAFLEKNGLTENIHPDEFYPLEIWMNFLNDVYEAGAGAATSSYVAIGLQEAKTARFPADVKTFRDAIMMIEEAYYNAYAGKDIGGIHVTEVGERHLQLEEQTPLPDDYFYGVCYGFGRRFSPPGGFKVAYNPSIKRRDEGGDVTVIDITWG